MIMIFALISLAIYAYSPIVCIFLCLLYAIIRPNSKFFFENAIVGFIISLSIATVYSGKPLISAKSTDFLIYFQYYKDISSGGVWSEFRFGLGYYFLNRMLAPFEFNEIQLAIAVSFICIYLNFIAVFFFVKRKYQTSPILFICIISCFLFKLGSLSLLWRQSIAAAFIIMALSENKPKNLIYYILSILFHSSSIYIYPITWYLVNKNITRVHYFIVTILAVSIFIFKYHALNILPSAMLNKFNFALEMEFQLMYLLDAIKTIIYFVPVVILSALFSKRCDIRESREYKTLVFSFFFIICLSFVPHSFRIIYPYTVILISVYSALTIIKMKNYYLITLVLLVAFGMLRFMSNELTTQYDLVVTTPFQYFHIKAL